MGCAASDSKVKGRLLQENDLVCKENFGDVKTLSIKNIVSWKNESSPVIDVAKARAEGGEARESWKRAVQPKGCNAPHTRSNHSPDRPWEHNSLQLLESCHKTSGQTFTAA